MLISWMGYALALSVCAAVVGSILDRLASIWGAPRRWAWLLVLIASVATSPMLAVRPAPAKTIAGELDHAPVAALAVSALPRSIIAAVTGLPWTAIAIAIWGIGTLACLALILRDLVRVTRRRSSWRRTQVDGVLVFLSNDDGPAVVGLRHPVIVLPAWSLTLAPHQRSLMLRHEREHLATGDYRLAFYASLAVMLLPWCVGLWWIARRLRLAIEIDCDARVLRSTASPREYGLLLIAVGARQSLSLPFAMSLAERQPLEERILAMTMVRPARPTMASMPLVALGIIAVALLAKTPVPEPLVTSTKAKTPAVGRLTELPAVHVSAAKGTTVSARRAEPSRPVRAVHASPTRVSAAVKAASSRTQTITGSFVVDAKGAVVPDTSRILVSLQDSKSDSFSTALFVPHSVDRLATMAGADSAPFSMVGDLTVAGVTRPVKWIGSARSKGDTVRGTARTAFSVEDFGLVSSRKATVPSVKDSIRLEYDFDVVTVKQ